MWSISSLICSLEWIMMFNIFSYAYYPFLFIFEEMSIPIFCLFLNWVICLYIIELWVFFTYFRYKSLFRCIIYKYFLQVCGLSFQFVDENWPLIILSYIYFEELLQVCHVTVMFVNFVSFPVTSIKMPSEKSQRKSVYDFREK